jgi:hypothetical protein
VCNTTNNSSTSCNASTCGGSCNTNQSNCDPDSANHNKNECETQATDPDVACGTNSCSPCSSGGIITTHFCTLGGLGVSATCTYSCDNTKCPNTNAASHTCDGVKCSYSCSGGFADCNPTSAPNNDGCECKSAATAIQGTVGGCCASTPNKCQIEHDTGFGSEHFYDCIALSTFDSTQATKACVAHGGSDCTHIGTCPSSSHLLCDNVVGPTGINCNCWQYDGSNGGGAGKVSKSTDGCKCTLSGDANWR